MNGKGILIVEDENIVALDMRMRLESLGYSVIGVVDNGNSALDFVSHVAPDLVLMDIKLKGGTDGIETARLVREHIEVPVIFVTAFTDEGTLERAKLASPYGYIVKPFHERELRIAIELALYKFQYELSMRRSKDLAEEANRMKGEFLANVSHELKTPLNSVIGFTELSLDRAVDEEQREYLATVLRSSNSLVTLIDSILDFARLENGHLTPVYAPFSLDELLGECVDFLSVGAKSKGLDVSFRRDKALPDSIICDRGRLKQILMNLLDNAVKFTDKGRVRLCVELAHAADKSSPSAACSGYELRRASDKSNLLRLIVEDTGIGMPEDKIAKAFERFTQLDGSSTRQAGGTGIGLAIVSKSVDVLGGSISVKSSLESGSRFEVLLPFLFEQRKETSDRLPLMDRHVALVGFTSESLSDLAETLASLGADSMMVDSLDNAVSEAYSLVISDETMAAPGDQAIAALKGKLIVACGPGSLSRGRLVAMGCAIVPHPVRALPLLAAVESLHSKVDPGSFSSGKPYSRPVVQSAIDLDKLDPGSASENVRIEFVHFIDALTTSLGDQDFQRAEREAKKYRELFLGLDADAFERLAFSALLLARKLDKRGLGEIIRRAQKLEKLSEEDGGGKSNAFPGR